MLILHTKISIYLQCPASISNPLFCHWIWFSFSPLADHFTGKLDKTNTKLDQICCSQNNWKSNTNAPHSSHLPQTPLSRSEQHSLTASFKTAIVHIDFGPVVQGRGVWQGPFPSELSRAWTFGVLPCLLQDMSVVSPQWETWVSSSRRSQSRGFFMNGPKKNTPNIRLSHTVCNTGQYVQLDQD